MNKSLICHFRALVHVNCILERKRSHLARWIHGAFSCSEYANFSQSQPYVSSTLTFMTFRPPIWFKCKTTMGTWTVQSLSAFNTLRLANSNVWLVPPTFLASTGVQGYTPEPEPRCNNQWGLGYRTELHLTFVVFTSGSDIFAKLGCLSLPVRSFPALPPFLSPSFLPLHFRAL